WGRGWGREWWRRLLGGGVKGRGVGLVEVGVGWGVGEMVEWKIGEAVEGGCGGEVVEEGVERGEEERERRVVHLSTASTRGGATA
ncbi:hypothetical protein, partial [Kocuria rhizophila]|uniref:hypothetical protein n=1 Tax=Kocuria rhizophila TaxID=72000 RepID=UPI001C92BCBD